MSVFQEARERGKRYRNCSEEERNKEISAAHAIIEDKYRDVLRNAVLKHIQELEDGLKDDSEFVVDLDIIDLETAMVINLFMRRKYRVKLVKFEKSKFYFAEMPKEKRSIMELLMFPLPHQYPLNTKTAAGICEWKRKCKEHEKMTPEKNAMLLQAEIMRTKFNANKMRVHTSKYF